MKRIIALISISIICFVLVACGKSNADKISTNNETVVTNETELNNNEANSKNDTTSYVGVWENEHFRFVITKGGIGRYEKLNSKESYDLNWEIKDEVLITQISFMGMEHKAALELGEDMSSLIVLQNGFPVYVDGEDVFTKQQ